MAPWSDLPVELLSMIDEHNEQLVDKIRFQCVCKHWQSLGSNFPDFRKPQQPPWLLLPYANDSSSCGLYHPFSNEIFQIEIPEAGEKVFKGSGHGWVVTAQENGSISVFNPLSRKQFPLPPRYRFPDVTKYRTDKIGKEYLLKPSIFTPDSSMNVRNNMLEKVVLSSAPGLGQDDGYFRAVALYGSLTKLAYCKIGDKKWRPLLATDGNDYVYEDVTFHGGKLYALRTREGGLMVCDDVVSCPVLRKLVPVPEALGLTSYVKLVNAHDGVIAVNRGVKVTEVPVAEGGSDYSFTSKTVGFKVFKLDTTSLSWARVESLGSRVLFMGKAQQWCVDVDSNMGSQIYFSTQHIHFKIRELEDCFDDGIYSVEDETFRDLGYKCSPSVIWPLPIWVTLNPY